MKKIRTKYSEAKKQKRNQMIVGVILVFVMFGSVFGVIVGSFGQDKEDKNIEYNGIEFVEQNGFWFASKGNLNFVFRNNPKQVKKIGSELNYFNNYEGKPLYIYSEHYEAELEVLRNFFYQNQIVQRVQPACLDEEEDIFNQTTECDVNLPIKNCENNFIIIRESNDTKIVQNKNCVFIHGEKENLTKITDEFLFNVFGIRE
ncbi:hypothetical protein KAT80_03105 [Candidatus Pacearchaeota archaeon]|nr:hypothetical protein [Candidatus Pacearchaeota archaeon]